MTITIKQLLLIAASILLAAAISVSGSTIAQEQTDAQLPLRYGPIQQTDTLWRIASRHRPDESVTIHQTMAAILAENPEAFRNNSIHYMLTGFYLDIPDRETIASHDPEQSRFDIIEQLEQPQAVQRAAADSLTTQEIQPEQQDSNAQQVETERFVNIEARVVQSAEQQETIEQRLEALREQVDESIQTTARLGSENEELNERLSGLTELLDDVRQSVQSTAEIEREIQQIQQQQNALEQEQSRVTSQTKWFTWPWIAIPIGILVLIFLLIIIWIIRRCRPAEEAEQSPYQAVVAVQTEDDTSDKSSEEVDSEQQVASDTESEHQESNADDTSDADDEEFFRDIDEILAEADATEQDEEEEPVNTEQSEKDQLAAELDLARAYLEMGEKEEAREIIAKVIKKADSELKVEAESLLKRVDEG